MISYIRKMKNVERMSGVPKLRSYNLQEHSFGVTALFQYFASKEDVSYDMVVFKKVLFHDILESVSGDLNYIVKNKNEITKECWSKIEDEVLKDNVCLNQFSDRSIEETLTPIQFQLLKACDILDLWLWCKEEYDLGNHHKDLIQTIKNCENFIPKDFKCINKFCFENRLFID